MRILVIVETDGADDGLDEKRPFSEYKYDIEELLSSGYYEVEMVAPAED